MLLKNKLKEWFWPIFLTAVVAVVCGANYQPGTWLSGWDTLHPEFNFSIYFKRILSVWQEHQGLGAPPSQAHAAEIPRILISYPLSWFLPASALRYTYFFLTLWLGVLGIYFFILKTVFKKSSLGAKTASFIGGLFYLLNLVIVQHYFVPLEMFATAFATNGWLFLTALNFLKGNKRKDLFWFLVISFLSAPMAHTATLWYVYFLNLVFFIIIWCWLTRKRWQKGIILIVVSLLVNSYWLIPNLYYALNHGRQMASAQINNLFSEEAFLQSAKYGTLKDLAFGRNFLFSWHDYDFRQNSFVDLMAKWEEHWEKPIVTLFAYSVFCLSLMGILISFKKRLVVSLSLLPIFFLSVFFWLNINPPLGRVFGWFQEIWPFFKEVFRFPFTKFSLSLIFTEAVFLAVTMEFVINWFGRRIRETITCSLIGILLAINLIYFSWPVFSGYLISPHMRIKIPQDYFELFKWFNQKGQGRVVLLPVHSQMGWKYYQWGFQGAGFLWFGLKQPLMDREFDRWYPLNEQFYYELSQAIYSQDLIRVESTLEKYQVNWLIMDENIINPGSERSLYIDKLYQMLGRSEKIKGVKTIGKIKIYEVKLAVPVKDFVFLAEDLPLVAPKYQWNDQDQAFWEFGYYFSNLEEPFRVTAGVSLADIFYPFRSLFTGRKQEELEFEIKDLGDKWEIKNRVEGRKIEGMVLEKPSLKEEEKVFWTKDLQEEVWSEPEVWLSSSTPGESLRPTPGVSLPQEIILEVRWPKKEGYYTYDSAKDLTFFDQPVKSCNPFNDGWKKREKIESGEGKEAWIRFESLGSNNCLGIDLPHFSQKIGYLVKVQSRHLEGKSLLFYVINKTSQKNVIETYLAKAKGKNEKNFVENYFIIPPMEEFGQGYSLNFDNISFGRQKTVNELGKVEVWPIQYRFLKELKLVNSSFLPKVSRVDHTRCELEVKHPNPSWYQVQLNCQEKTHNQAALTEEKEKLTLVLSQAYHSGWLAWEGKPFVGKRLAHVLVNNWENGWQLDNLGHNLDQFQTRTKTIYIFFWPQILEYAGFVLLALLMIWVLKKH